MAKAYMVRHQRAGILTSHIFTSTPTDGQIEMMKVEADRRHGAGWVRVHEADILAAKDLPSFPRVAEATATAGAPEFQTSGTGTVKNPTK